MSVARVRIAPVERWCDEAKSHCGIDLQGREVPIHTSPVTANRVFRCGGKEWIVEKNWSIQRDIEIGDTRPYIPAFVCEHMLEMD